MHLLLSLAFTLLIHLASSERSCPIGTLLNLDKTRCFHYVPVPKPLTDVSRICENLGLRYANAGSNLEQFMATSAFCLDQQKKLEDRIAYCWIGGHESLHPVNATLPFLCEQDSIEDKPVTCEPCTTTPAPLNWIPFDNHLYAHVRKFTPKGEAEEWCAEQGGQLTSILSKEENDFIGSICTDYCMTGGFSPFHNQTYVWQDGTPMVYTKWYHDMPKSSNERYCVIYTHEGWASYQCTKPLPFICKKPQIA
ncbi:hypothetical protein L596_022735 [Steinernema carpocapsae]|uniref:C-type lectin domain-containing protein n=1 Tax=Steinernema carpocapsae TaxID=34508 RepID=A0A4U5MMN9_STECR|nr:hypothetical protein L596_022735 [Steinernema carpocapsae]